MDLRQMKLALTVDLMNLSQSQDLVKFVTNKMHDYSSEIGHLQEITESSPSQLRDQLESQTFNLQFENCILQLDVVGDRLKNQEYLQNFNLIDIHNN
ncbi:MAG: hypothetical protein AAFZ15_17455 [Bacteroidota bacterium]